MRDMLRLAKSDVSQKGLERGNGAGRRDLQADQTAQTNAKVLENMPSSEKAANLFARLEKTQGASDAARIFEHMDSQKAAALLEHAAKSMDEKRIASIFKRVDSGKVAEVLGHMGNLETVVPLAARIDAQKAAGIAFAAGPELAARLFEGMTAKDAARIFTEMTTHNLTATAQTLEIMRKSDAARIVERVNTRDVVNILEQMNSQGLADIIKSASIDKTKIIIETLDANIAASMFEAMAKHWPIRAAHRLEKVSIDQAASIYKALNDETVGKISGKMAASGVARLVERVNRLNEEPVGQGRLVEILREVANRTKRGGAEKAEKVAPKQFENMPERPAVQAGRETQAVSSGDEAVKRPLVEQAQASLFERRSPEDVARVFERMVQNKEIAKAAGLLEGFKSQKAAEALKNLDAKVALEIYQQLNPASAARIALAIEPKLAALTLEQMKPGAAAPILKEMARGDLTQTARTLGALDLKKASVIVKRLDVETAANIIGEVGSQRAALILEKVPIYKTVQIVKHLGLETEVVGNLLGGISAKRTADVMAAVMMVGDTPSAAPGRFSELQERITFYAKYAKYKAFADIRRKALIGLGALVSTAVTGYIDQAQLMEQRGTLMNSYIFDSYMGGFLGSFLVGNLFYRFTQSYVLPEKLPIVGGKTIGSSTTLYQIAFSLAWGAVGTAVQLVVQPYILSKMGIAPA